MPDIQRAMRKKRATVHAYVPEPVDSQKLIAAVVEQAYRVRDGAPFEPPIDSTSPAQYWSFADR